MDTEEKGSSLRELRVNKVGKNKLGTSTKHKALDSVVAATHRGPLEAARATIMELNIGSKMPELDDHLQGLLLLNVLCLLFGSNISVLKMQHEVDPALFSTLRFSVAFLPFTNLVLKARDNLKTLKAGIELGLYGGAGYITQEIALQTANSSQVSFLGALTVIVVPLLSVFSGREVKPITWFASLVALYGVNLLECSGSANLGGDVWGIVSAVLFGVQIYRTECVVREKCMEDQCMSLVSLQLATIAFMCIGWLGFNAATDPSVDLGGELANISVPALVYTGLITTSMSLWIEFNSLKSVSATEAALIYTSEPLWGAAFSWLLLGERWGPTGWMGAACVVGASVVTQLGNVGEGPAEEDVQASSSYIVVESTDKKPVE